MRTSLAVGLSLIVASAGIFAFSPRHTAELLPTSIPITNMTITDIEATSAGFVASGELGHILISNDEELNWTKATLSNQRDALITEMVFDTADHGLAIGHEGWILQTVNGGRHWQEVAFNDNSSDPLFSLAKFPSGRWLSVGAFGKSIISDDNGNSWQDAAPLQEIDWHLNALIPSDDKQTWLIVGEAGTVIKSTDAGDSWQNIAPFYEGSFYGGLHLGGENWLIYGMRGNVFRTQDNGDNWEKIEIGLQTSLFTHTLFDSGELLIGGQGGLLFLSEDQGASFTIKGTPSRISLTGIKKLSSGELLLSSDRGLFRQPSLLATKTMPILATGELKSSNQSVR